MALQTKSFSQLVSEQVAVVQGSSSSLVDFTIGSILRAIVEAYAAVALWLQGLILEVLALTRAATSTGADLDSWVGDYGVVRLGAATTTGAATFSRFTPTAQAVVPVGAAVQSADGSQKYLVTLDTANTAYNAGFGGYVIGAGIASVTVPIAAVTTGAAGNAAIGGINTLGQAIAGVDSVTNAASLTNGSDAETDPALRARFIQYIASLSKATKAAIGYAASSVETGITYAIVENQDYDGTTDLGYFYVVIDDGTGTPSSGLRDAIYAAIDLVRGFTIRFGVFAPIVVTANVAAAVTVAAGYNATTIKAAVRTAIINYINALPLGAGLAWSRLFQVAYDVSPAVTDVTVLTVNSATIDIAGLAKDVVKAGTVVVS